MRFLVLVSSSLGVTVFDATVEKAARLPAQSRNEQRETQPTVATIAGLPNGIDSDWSEPVVVTRHPGPRPHRLT